MQNEFANKNIVKWFKMVISGMNSKQKKKQLPVSSYNIIYIHNLSQLLQLLIYNPKDVTLDESLNTFKVAIICRY